MPLRSIEASGGDDASPKINLLEYSQTEKPITSGQGSDADGRAGGAALIENSYQVKN
jgi:hypothetical protein